MGAEVTLTQGGRVVGYRVVQSSTGYCSQDPSRLHFGVGSGATFELHVRFPNGVEVTRTGVSPGQVVTIDGAPPPS